jgi:hypothetical protein
MKLCTSTPKVNNFLSDPVVAMTVRAIPDQPVGSGAIQVVSNDCQDTGSPTHTQTPMTNAWLLQAMSSNPDSSPPATMPHMVSQIFEVLWCRRFWSECIVPNMYFVLLDVLSLIDYMP